MSNLAHFSLEDSAGGGGGGGGRGPGSGSGYSAEDLAEMMRGSIVDSDEDGGNDGAEDGGSPGEYESIPVGSAT